MRVGVWAMTISASLSVKGRGEKGEERPFFIVKQQGDCVKSLPDHSFITSQGIVSFLKSADIITTQKTEVSGKKKNRSSRGRETEQCEERTL